MAEVIEVVGLVYKVKYLKKSGDFSNKFIREDDNIYDVELEDIIMKLPPPSGGHGSSRCQYLMFDIDLTSFIVQYYYLTYYILLFSYFLLSALKYFL